MALCLCLRRGWNSGYIHGPVFVPEEGVELWLYSWPCVCARGGGGTLAIFMALCLCLRRGWNSGYIHGPVFVPEEGVELWLYSWPCVCTRGGLI